MVLGEALAVLSAALYASGEIFVKRGLMSGGTVFRSLYITAIMNNLVLWPPALLSVDPSRIGLIGLGFLMLGGLMGSTLARMMRVVALGNLGVGGSAPLVASYPLFAALFAIAIRGEQLTATLAFGTVLIVLGVSLLFRGEWKISRLGVLVSLSAAVLFGAAESFRKLGVIEVGSPSFAAAVGAIVTLASVTSYSKATGSATGGDRRTGWLFIGCGIANSAALLTTFMALSIADVVVVAPLSNTTALFAIILAKLFLSEHERITPRIVVSALTVLAGATLIVAR